MQVDLVMFKADGQRREFRLRKPVTVIGRSTECDFQIPLAMVSRKHCQITLKADHIAVRDMGSSNGTFVNDLRVQQGDLQAGDKLVVGPVTFFVVVDGEPANLDAIRTTATPGAAGGEIELEEGTVDVEAQQEQRRAPSVQRKHKKTRGPAKHAAPPEEVEELEPVEEVVEVHELQDVAPAEEIEEVEEVQERHAGAAGEPKIEATEPVEEVQEVAEAEEEAEEEPLPQDPLAALEAMTRPKNRPS